MSHLVSSTESFIEKRSFPSQIRYVHNLSALLHYPAGLCSWIKLVVRNFLIGDRKKYIVLLSKYDDQFLRMCVCPIPVHVLIVFAIQVNDYIIYMYSNIVYIVYSLIEIETWIIRKLRSCRKSW